MSETQKSISDWADETFGPVKNPISSITRVNKEIAELLHALETGSQDHDKLKEELADIEIVLRRVATEFKCDLQEEVDKKMQVNRNRRWKLDGSGHGQHID